MGKYILLFSALLLGGRAGPAQTPVEPLEPKTTFFDCDAPAGKFTGWSRAFAARSIRVDGALELAKSRKDAEWIPVANVRFLGPPEADNVGLRAFVVAKAPSEIQVMIEGPEALVKGTGVATLNWRNGRIPFALSLTDSGEFSASIAGMTRTLALGPFEANTLDMRCSTGHFHLTAKVTIEGALATHDYAVGQVWTYRVREGDDGSVLQINRIDEDPRFGTIVYITVFGFKLDHPGKEDSTPELNVPVSTVTLDKSVVALTTDQARLLAPNAKFYEAWKKAFATQEARLYTDSVAELLVKAQKSLEKKEH